MVLKYPPYNQTQTKLFEHDDVYHKQISIYLIRTNLHTTPYDGGESTSIPPALPHQTTSSTMATVPRRSIANRRCKRRLHTYANRKLRSSKLFGRSGPTYTPYHMMVESRPPNLLIRLIRAPLRLQRRYHADPLLTGAAFVVYTHMPIANYAVASSCVHLPYHNFGTDYGRGE